MRPVRFKLFCGTLLAIAIVSPSAFAVISDEGQRKIEALRQKHQNTGVEANRPSLRNLVDQLRENQKQLTATTPALTPTNNSVGIIPSSASAPAIEVLPITTDTQIVELPVTASATDRFIGTVQAEKYEHLTYTASQSPKKTASTPVYSQESNKNGFQEFIIATFALFSLFSAGSILAGSGGKTASPGFMQIAGAIMLVVAFCLGAVTMVRFWPFLLLLGFCAMFSRSPRTSNGSSCGCGCGLLLLITILTLF